MRIDLLNERVRWINVESDKEKAEQMVELLDRLEFKNAERFNAITSVDVKEKNQFYVTHCCGESHFHTLEETIIKDGKPVLIFEDDIEVEQKNFRPVLDIPNDADALYLGTSHGDGKYEALAVNESLYKIKRVFACHAILFLNPAYAKAVVEDGRNTIYNLNGPFDVTLAYNVQPRYNIYAVRDPFFFQADAKNTTNMYENITRTPLFPKKVFNTVMGA
tara:strand:+ start:275 stop:931 length:657 start_codon:yes stop_codon:yes gene_type:complete